MRITTSTGHTRRSGWRRRLASRTRGRSRKDRTTFQENNNHRLSQQVDRWTGSGQLLFCGDIANYGAATAYASQHVVGFDDVNPEAALFRDARISQVHTAGDGFICALPVLEERAIRTDLKRFAKAYAAYLSGLEHLNARIAEHVESAPRREAKASTLGSRLAVHYGTYRYGKISDAGR